MFLVVTTLTKPTPMHDPMFPLLQSRPKAGAGLGPSSATGATKTTKVTSGFSSTSAADDPTQFVQDSTHPGGDVGELEMVTEPTQLEPADPEPSQADPEPDQRTDSV